MSVDRIRVLIVNPRSGGGAAERCDLVAQCRARGIDPVVFDPDGDLGALARSVADSGPDVIGMAGGDGSQATVAAIAAERGLPFVCVPAGTRNHFALDIGIDRTDVVGALDAFTDGEERRIDLARVNGRIFVNNVSLGVYGALVRSPSYRDAKIRTVMDLLPDLVGPGAEPPELRFTDPGGRAFTHADVLLVSNNPYDLSPKARHRRRGALDDGTLGVLAIVGPPPGGLREWATPTFRVDSTDTLPVGIDGEAVTLDPPVVFESVPGALRTLTPRRRLSRSRLRRS